MQLDLGGHPIQTRALSIVLTQGDAGRWRAAGSVLDLRQRGFLPVGGDLQGMGIIHHMELTADIAPRTATLERLEVAQPTVAFEACAGTEGESCRDPVARVAKLEGAVLGEGFASQVREHIGGVRGCSHVATLTTFLGGAVAWALGCETAAHPAGLPARVGGEGIYRRDLVFHGHERSPGRLAVAMQMGDLHWRPAGAVARAFDRFAAHLELRAQLEVDLWPGELLAIDGAQRVRTAQRFAEAEWESWAAPLRALRGWNLARGANRELAERLGGDERTRPWRHALFMFAPALVQCRAAHADPWLNKAATTAGHPGLTAVPDSCYMWRRDGGLARVRERGNADR